MLGRFGRDAGSLLGVEIASDSIRMLHLHRQRVGWRVQGWAQERFEPALPDSAASDEAEGLVLGLRRAHVQCRTRQFRVALALPASQVICKVCRLPVGLADLDVEAAVLAQAEQLFPFPLEDLALDFWVQGACANDPGQFEVLVVACRQSQLDPLERVFTRAGLQLEAVEVDSFALRRALLPEVPARGAVLLQLEPGEVVMHRWHGSPAPQRQRLALGSPAQWDEAVDDLWRLGKQARVEEVVLFGCAADAERAAYLRERLGVKCQVGCPRPLAGLPGRDGPRAASMVLACGLAMGGRA
ncbi:pilus assembly protein PilM [Pseudomonas sp. BW13M1]|uniref:Pilus assembly protein PilM n=1 Tax=Pseudomonas peradeniyensis TaxID=2745488 RepID=A0A923G5J1_9PSED|nr:pilus assembly protein PilM [Pseudomonas peradeniyensis]MBV4505170.1 pilus assembly protein PilM [Pseudomonas peradeniyensis]